MSRRHNSQPNEEPWANQFRSGTNQDRRPDHCARSTDRTDQTATPSGSDLRGYETDHTKAMNEIVQLSQAHPFRFPLVVSAAVFPCSVCRFFAAWYTMLMLRCILCSETDSETGTWNPKRNTKQKARQHQNPKRNRKRKTRNPFRKQSRKKVLLL